MPLPHGEHCSTHTLFVSRGATSGPTGRRPPMAVQHRDCQSTPPQASPLHRHFCSSMLRQACACQPRPLPRWGVWHLVALRGARSAPCTTMQLLAWSEFRLRLALASLNWQMDGSICGATLSRMLPLTPCALQTPNTAPQSTHGATHSGGEIWL